MVALLATLAECRQTSVDSAIHITPSWSPVDVHWSHAGTLLRSPRSHVLSQFSHCHAAHHSSWARAAADVPLYLAEGILRVTEYTCGDSCDLGNPQWKAALEQRLAAGLKPPADEQPQREGGAEAGVGAATATAMAAGASWVRVISLENTQAHALTCSKARGSVGQHFKASDGAPGRHVGLLERGLVGAR